MTTLRFADYRAHLEQIYEAALLAVDPRRCVQRDLVWDKAAGHLAIGPHQLPLPAGRIFLIAAGKAAIPMAAAAADQLGELLYQGVVIHKQTAEAPAGNAQHPYLTHYPAAHPVSDQSSVAATHAARELLRQTTADDLVICLISGGSSALLTAPLIPLEDWQMLNQALLASGCSIHTFNRIRQQLDEVKGGGLLRWSAPAPVYSLILSDVIGDNLSIIGSGPTVPPIGNPGEADSLLQSLGVYDRLPAHLTQRIQAQLAPKDGTQSILLPPHHNHLVANLKIAADAALTTAVNLGFSTQILTTHLEGAADQMGLFAAALAIDARGGQALILGGESTVVVKGAGRGGRNQELALAAVPVLMGEQPVALAALATDGEDRLAGVAGAIATHRTGTKVMGLKLDVAAALADNDSYTFWHSLSHTGDPYIGGLVERAPTGTNVNDLIIILRYEA